MVELPRSEGSLRTWVGALPRFGGMAEWTKAAVLKTAVGQPTGGSNPSPSASKPIVSTRIIEDRPAIKKALRPSCGMGAQNKYGEVPEWLNGAAC